MDGQAKLKQVTYLVDKLSDDLEPLNIPPQTRVELLEELKVHGRDPRNADPIFADKGISMLLQYAFYNEDRETSRSALRVLSNSMLLKPHTRQLFLDRNFAPIACSKLNTDSWDDEFLLSRVLFLSTYGQGQFVDLVEKHSIADSISANLGRHEAYLSNGVKENAQMELMSLDQTLKLLFNITYNCPKKISEFASAVPHLVALLWKEEKVSAKDPLKDVPGSIVNALFSLDLKDPKHHDVLFPKDDTFKLSNRLVEFLQASLKTYDDRTLEASVTPLVHLLGIVYEQAPEDVKKGLREALLPSEEDRKEVLGKGTTTSALLLKNATNTSCHELQGAIKHLFFNLSGKDASKFVENVGYGIASGYLFENNIPPPDAASETQHPTTSERPVNPVTGQFLDAERPVNEPEMTEEEKLREAERLFVLFERLRATGVMDVQNPVETAIREGRFRELRDDEVEELD